MQRFAKRIVLYSCRDRNITTSLSSSTRQIPECPVLMSRASMMSRYVGVCVRLASTIRHLELREGCVFPLGWSCMHLHSHRSLQIFSQVKRVLGVDTLGENLALHMDTKDAVHELFDKVAVARTAWEKKGRRWSGPLAPPSRSLCGQRIYQIRI